MINEGCGAEDKMVRIEEGYEGSANTELRDFKKGKNIKIRSLSGIVNRFGIRDACLKVDCEGCEYGIFLNTDNKSIAAFDTIMIEFHDGHLNLMKKLVGAGFEVRCHANPNPAYGKSTGICSLAGNDVEQS